MRTAADACIPTNLPGWALEFSYADGDCIAPIPVGRRTISSLAQAIADAGDVEPGNPGWAAWVPWVVRCRKAGKDPYLYCCDDNYGGSSWDGWRHQDGVKAFAVAGVAEPHWWVFNNNRSTVPDYAEMVQVAQDVGPGYDISICNPYLPGLDPAPLKEIPPVNLQNAWIMEPEGFTAPWQLVTETQGTIGIDSGAQLQNLQAAYPAMVVVKVDQEFYAAVRAAAGAQH